MNVISECWEELVRSRPTLRPPSTEDREWERIITDYRRIHIARAQYDREDVGRVACRYALSVPARSEAIVWARLPARLDRPDDWVLVEPHGNCRAVEVARGLAVVRKRVRNTSPYLVSLHRHQQLVWVTSVEHQQV